MFDSEQYPNHPYHPSRHMDPTNQSSFFPYIYPSYRSELNLTAEIPESKTGDFVCQWIDPDTNRMCGRIFSHMQDIGTNSTHLRSFIFFER